VAGQQLTYRYDTVMLVASDHLPEEEVRAKLTERGDSLVMASAGGLTKVHVHTNEPYDAIRYLMRFAPIREGRIEDMQYQANEYAGVSGTPEATDQAQTSGGCAERELDTAYVVVSPGPGFDEIFHKLGAHIIVSGGDTMNPPTEAFVDPIAACDAKVLSRVSQQQEHHPGCTSGGHVARQGREGHRITASRSGDCGAGPACFHVAGG